MKTPTLVSPGGAVTLRRSAPALLLLAALSAPGWTQQIHVTPAPNAPLPVTCARDVLDQAWTRGSTLVWRGDARGAANAVALLVAPYAHASLASSLLASPVLPTPFAAAIAGPSSLLVPIWLGQQPGVPQLAVDLPGLQGPLSIQALYVSASGNVLLGTPWIVYGDPDPWSGRAQVGQDTLPVFTGAPAPGSRPGNERWIVHFERRGFDTEALANEYQGARHPGRVAAIVADFEVRVRADQAPFVTAVELLGARVVQQWWLVNACLIEVDRAKLAAVAALPNVDFLQPDEVVVPLIKASTDALNHDADALQAAGYTGAGATAAVIDTGQDENMAGTGQIHVTYSTAGNKSLSRLVLNRQIGAMPADDVNGHGTGVASIVAGWRWNTAQADEGHAFGGNIAGYAIANAANGGSTLSTMATAYQTVAADAAANNIVATNLSYSGSPNPSSVEQKAADNLTLTADVLNATAAGNSGTSLGSSLLNLNGLSVGATYPDPWPSNPSLVHTVAAFSCRGLINGNMPFPTMCANGVSTVMALRDNENANFVDSGTSMASPQVCGAATQLRARFPALKANETKAILLASSQASPGTGATQSTTGPGCGYLHSPSAHAIAGSLLRHGIATVTKNSTTWTRTLAVTQGVQTQVAIAWHRLDPKKNWWANLNLEVRDGSTVVASSATGVSTLEFVRFTPLASGNYTIVVTVVKSSMVGSTQQFAWASSHDTL
jgi:hypothetical protein